MTTWVLRIYSTDDEVIVEHPLTVEACQKLAEVDGRGSLRKDCSCPLDLRAYVDYDAEPDRELIERARREVPALREQVASSLAELRRIANQ